MILKRPDLNSFKNYRISRCNFVWEKCSLNLNWSGDSKVCYINILPFKKIIPLTLPVHRWGFNVCVIRHVQVCRVKELRRQTETTIWVVKEFYSLYTKIPHCVALQSFIYSSKVYKYYVHVCKVNRSFANNHRGSRNWGPDRLTVYLHPKRVLYKPSALGAHSQHININIYWHFKQ